MLGACGLELFNYILYIADNFILINELFRFKYKLRKKNIEN